MVLANSLYEFRWSLAPCSIITSIPCIDMSVEMKCDFIGSKDFLKLQCSMTELSSYSSCKCESVHFVILPQFLSYNRTKWVEVEFIICNYAKGAFRQSTIVSSARPLWVISK